MANLKSIQIDTAAQIGVNPRRVKMLSYDSLATITTAGYLNPVQTLEAAFLANTDVIDCFYSYVNANNPGTYVELLVAISNGVITLSNASASSSGPVVVTTTEASATPGTVRSITGKISDSTVMTSGNLVGVRGEVDSAGASGGFLYGVQGKVILTGTLSGSEWTAGVFGQLDISGGTINAGQAAAIWGDYGSASGTLTNQTGLYGIAMTNTTAAVLEGQIYLYGGAQNLLLLNTNAGLSGTTYFQAAGTGANSAGAASYAAGTEVLQISVNGTNYWLKCFTSNS